MPNPNFLPCRRSSSEEVAEICLIEASCFNTKLSDALVNLRSRVAFINSHTWHSSLQSTPAFQSSQLTLKIKINANQTPSITNDHNWIRVIDSHTHRKHNDDFSNLPQKLTYAADNNPANSHLLHQQGQLKIKLQRPQRLRNHCRQPDNCAQFKFPTPGRWE